MVDSTDHNVLFLCTGNSARSIMAEALLRFHGGHRFNVYSAGSQPAGQVHPLATEMLSRHNINYGDLHSKSIEQFLGDQAPNFHFVFTLCDHAAEQCPIFSGQPMTAHWGIPDPATAEGSEIDRMQAFRHAYAALENRIKIFTCLPLSSLDKLRLQESLDAIGDPRPSY